MIADRTTYSERYSCRPLAGTTVVCMGIHLFTVSKLKLKSAVDACEVFSRVLRCFVAKRYILQQVSEVANRKYCFRNTTLQLSSSTPHRPECHNTQCHRQMDRQQYDANNLSYDRQKFIKTIDKAYQAQRALM